MKFINIGLPTELHRQLKRQSFELGISLKDGVVRAIEGWVSDGGQVGTEAIQSVAKQGAVAVEDRPPDKPAIATRPSPPAENLPTDELVKRNERLKARQKAKVNTSQPAFKGPLPK